MGQFAFAIAAESFQGAIKQLLQENAITPDEDSALKAHILIAHLIPDNDNSYDSNAVRIDVNNRTVGYLNREQALSFRRRLDEKALANQITTCYAIITESSEENEKNNVKLDIEPLQ